jgi:Sigma-70, region 4
MSDYTAPAWGQAQCPLLPGFLRGRLASENAPKCLADWLGRPVTCAELDGHIWEACAAPLDQACLRQVADLVGLFLEPLFDLRPFPPIRGLGPLVAGLPLRNRTMNALGREGLLETSGHLELHTLAELTDIPNFGTVSLLDLLCVVEGAIAVGAASGGWAFADPQCQINGGKFLAWGTPGVPIVPALFRAALHGEPAPSAVQRWLGRSVTLDQLNEQVWTTAKYPLPPDVLTVVADFLASELGKVGSIQPFPQTSGLGPVLRQTPLRTRTMNALSGVGYLDADGGIERATVGQLMQMPNFGTVSLVDLLCVAEAALPVVGLPPMLETDTLGDLRIIAGWAIGEYAVETAGAILELTDAPRPPEVEAAWQRAFQFSVRDFAGDLAQHYSPPDVVAHFLNSLDDREEELLRDRILTIESPATLDEIARRHDLSRERVRQIEKRIKDRVADLRDSSVGRLAVTVFRRLGTAIPADSEEVAAVAELVVGYSRPALSRLLLLHLSGPYRADDGWILHLPSRSPLLETRQKLLDAAGDDGLVSRGAIRHVLDQAGIRHQWHDAWISRLGCLRGIGDSYLRWDGTTIDRLERLLRLRRQPATAEELIAELGEDLNPRGIKYRLMDDPRFIRINKQSQFALPEWGFDEYTGITDEIAQEIERCGGVADAEHLARTISSTYGVAETSVRAYLGAPMFIKSDGGTVRLRGNQDGQIPVDVDLPSAADCCLSPVGWGVRVLIDADVLRGSGKTISAAFACHVGVGPGNKITVPAPESMITVSWPVSSITGPSMGSIRAEARALDASPGDLLFLVYLADHNRFEPRLVRASDLEAAEGLPRLALLHGTQPSEDPGQTLLAIAHALGVEITDADDPASIVGLALTRRRQDSWRDLLPNGDKSETLDDVLDRLTKALG